MRAARFGNYFEKDVEMYYECHPGNQGNADTAVGQLQSPIDQVKDFVTAGALSRAQGQPLIDTANDIVANITEPTFPDVSKTLFAFGAIEFLVDEGIVSGRTNGRFDPEAMTTRAEFTKIAVLGAGLTPVTTATPSFIEAARQAGIVNGYPDGTFRPNARITRAEITKIIVEAGGFAINTSGSGFPDGTFRPNANTTRAEVAQMVFNWLVN